MCLRLLPLVVLFFLSPKIVFAQSAVRPPSVAANCPATRPFQTSLFIPPYPYPPTPGGTDFWFGSDRLWTSLPTDGMWRGSPQRQAGDSTIREKLFYWRAGYDVRSEQRPALTITGHRLDGPSSPLVTDEHANNGRVQPDQPFMVTGINVPTLGCWEITARYHGEELKFVVWVTR